ncbi:MAG: MarR family transcriptional regulator [Pseudomonadota bacterium]
MSTTTESQDLMDELMRQWASECPDFDTAAMAVVGRIMRLGRLYEKQAAAALRPFGLPYTDFDILATLRRSGAPYELTPGELGSAVLLTSGAMTAALDRLTTAELITRHARPEDRRVKSAKLTAAGRRLARKAASARFDVAAQSVEALRASDRKQLATLLKRLATAARPET